MAASAAAAAVAVTKAAAARAATKAAYATRAATGQKQKQRAAALGNGVVDKKRQGSPSSSKAVEGVGSGAGGEGSDWRDAVSADDLKDVEEIEKQLLSGGILAVSHGSF